MTEVVWKFDLHPGESYIDLPAGARLLHVATQTVITGEVACIWALCDPDAAREPRYVVAVPTGDAVPERGIYYVGTFTIDDGLVFHVFTEGWQ